jgi:hypothetical protein
MAEPRPLAPERLLRVLAGHGVDYVLIGGVAVQAYGHVSTTLDLDVIASWTPENVGRLAGAPTELGAQLRGVDAELLGIELGTRDARPIQRPPSDPACPTSYVLRQTASEEPLPIVLRRMTCVIHCAVCVASDWIPSWTSW